MRVMEKITQLHIYSDEYVVNIDEPTDMYLAKILLEKRDKF